MIRIIVIIIAGFISPLFISSQNIYIGVLDFNQPNEEEYKTSFSKVKGLTISTGDLQSYETRMIKDKQLLEKTRVYLIDEIGKDQNLVMVERKLINIITEEREYQKSEDFLDGYVVSQGKSIAADYLIDATVFLEKNKLSISIYSVGDNMVVASAIVKFKYNLVTGSNLQKEVAEAFNTMKTKVFPHLILVVRPLKEGKTIKELLIAGGLADNLQEKQTMDIFYIKEEIIQGSKTHREITIAKGVIDRVEGSNFSVLILKQGGKEVKELLDNNIELYCK